MTGAEGYFAAAKAQIEAAQKRDAAVTVWFGENVARIVGDGAGGVLLVLRDGVGLPIPLREAPPLREEADEAKALDGHLAGLLRTGATHIDVVYSFDPKRGPRGEHTIQLSYIGADGVPRGLRGSSLSHVALFLLHSAAARR